MIFQSSVSQEGKSPMRMMLRTIARVRHWDEELIEGRPHNQAVPKLTAHSGSGKAV